MNRERINYVFRGALLPVNNGYRSTGIAHIRELARQSSLREAVLVGEGAVPTDDEGATLAALAAMGVSARFEGDARAGGVEGWHRPWGSLRARVDPFARRRLAALGRRLAALEGPTILFTIGWDPLVHALPRRASRVTLFLADSITLFEHNRLLEVRGVRRVTARARRAVARAVERAALRRGYPAAVYVSPVDAGHARAIAGDDGASATCVVPLGVDLAQLPDVVVPSAAAIARAPEITFSGVMAFGPNAAAAHELVEEILPALGDVGVRLLLVGRDSEQFRAASPRVTALGWVESIPAEIQRAHLFVAPVRYGAGAKNNVLAALAMGLPVVGYDSIFTSFAVLPRGCHPCADQAELIATVRRLLADPEALVAQRAPLAQEIRTHWSWSAAVGQLATLAEEAGVAGRDE